jgi:uncharacterized protein
MKGQHASVNLIGLSVALGLCLASGTAAAQDIAWDLVSSTSHNLVSYGTDAPVFTAPGDGFQKYDVDVDPTAIPYSLVDDTLGAFPADAIGIVDSVNDHDEFFGICDIVNDTPPGPPYHATWVFDISSASGNLQLSVNLAAMGDFEAADTYVWTWQVDSGAVNTWLTAVADEAGSYTYTMADGTTRLVDDPLVVNGTTISNVFRTFTTPITPGSQLTVVLTSTTDGSYEGYAARNIVVSASSLIFANGFEDGTPGAWTSHTP